MQTDVSDAQGQDRRTSGEAHGGVAARVREEIGALFAVKPYWPRGLYFRSRSHKQFMASLQGYVAPGQRCLDLGCGAGGPYRPFLEAHGLEWSGADVMDAEPLGPRYRKVVDNRIAFEDESFDAVCAYNVIEHFTHPEAMFAEIRRVLKPGGVFCGACAFWEMEHDSFFHLSHLGLAVLLDRHGFELVSLTPSEYTGTVLVSQRFFGGAGRIDPHSRRSRVYTTLLGSLNWVPFLIVNTLEFLRRRVLRRAAQPLKDCATLYFFARKTAGRPAALPPA